MLVRQGGTYCITEWDGDVAVVEVMTVEGEVVECDDRGEPTLCIGGDVLVRYYNGEVLRSSAQHFEMLRPFPVPPRATPSA